MKWFLMALGGVVVTIAAGLAVIVFTPDYEEALDSQPTVTVVMSTERIDADQPLDPLLDAGVLEEVEIPVGSAFQGSVTELEQLRGMKSLVAIQAGEQIPHDQVAHVVCPVCLQA